MRFDQNPGGSLHGKVIHMLGNTPGTALVDDRLARRQLPRQTDDFSLASVEFAAHDLLTDRFGMRDTVVLTEIIRHAPRALQVIADGHAITTLGADHQPLQQRRPFTRRAPIAARHDTEYVRHGVRNVMMICEPKRGWREVLITERQTKIDFSHTMKHVVACFPEATTIRLVIDNLNTHKPASLRFVCGRFPE